MALAPIAAIIGAVASAATAGVSIDELVNKPSAAPAPKPGVSPQMSQNIKGAVSQQAPDITAATGGSVSPAYTLALSQLQSGTAGTPGAGGSAQQVINQLFGLGGPTTAGVGTTAPTGSGVADFKPAGAGGAANPGIVDEGLSDILRTSLAG